MVLSVFSIGHLVLSFIGGSANLIAICCLYKETTAFTDLEAPDTFILSLAISDLLVSVIAQPAAGIYYALGRPSYYLVGLLRYLYCLLFSMSLLNLSLLSLERLIKIVLPNKHDVWMENKKIVKVIVVCWLFEGAIHSTSFYLPMLLGIIQMLHVVGTLVVLIVCYVLIYRQQRISTNLVVSFHPGSNTTGEPPSATIEQNPNITQSKIRERRLIKKVLTLLLIHFVFIVISIVVVAGAIATFDALDQRGFVLFLAGLIASAKPTIVNPVLYVFRKEKFKKRLLKMCCYRKKRVEPERQ